MREEQIVALTLVGLMIWNITLYATSLPQTPAKAKPNQQPGSSNWYQIILSTIQPLSCLFSSLYGLHPPNCVSPGQTNSTATNSTGNQTALATPNFFFFPVLILTITSYINAFWIATGFASLRAHGRYEVEDSMTIAAVQALVPPILPIIIAIQILSKKMPATRTQPTPDKMMEA